MYMIYQFKDRALVEPLAKGRAWYNKQQSHGAKHCFHSKEEQVQLEAKYPVRFVDKRPKWFKDNVLKKQLVDQTAHATWTFLVVIIGLNVPILEFAFEMFGIEIVLPELLLGYAFIAAHACAIIYREVKQYPPRVWWDLPLDATFYILGAVGGYYAQ